MKSLDVITLVLLIVGGLNWGLWGLFEFDLGGESQDDSIWKEYVALIEVVDDSLNMILDFFALKSFEPVILIS